MNPCRKVVVTGASSGIGRATAVRFAREGYDVCVNARRESRLKELVASFPAGDHLLCAGDFSDTKILESLKSLLDAKWGSVDVLVNCAGIFESADAVSSELGIWRKPFDVMVEGGVGITRVVVPMMAAGGRIIHVTSIHGQFGEARGSAYAMAKAALNQFCRVLAIELAERGILVNAIAPGFIDTEMSVRP